MNAPVAVTFNPKKHKEIKKYCVFTHARIFCMDMYSNVLSERTYSNTQINEFARDFTYSNSRI